MGGEQVAGLWNLLKRAFSDWSVETLGRDLTTNVAAVLLIAFVASRWDAIRWYLTRERAAFRRMFGPGATRTSEIVAAVDTFKDARFLPSEVRQQLNIPAVPPEGARFFKVFPDNHYTAFSTGAEPILAYGSARAAAYIADSIGAVPGVSVRAVADEEVGGKWDAAFVCIGNSYRNIKTDDLKHSKSNQWLEDDGGEPRLKFRDGQIEELGQRRHLGYVMKLRNPHFPEYACIVCGGIGERGASGAAWFFARHWRRLSRRFRANSFLIVLAITPDSDQAVQEIRAFGRESMARRVWAWISRNFLDYSLDTGWQPRYPRPMDDFGGFDGGPKSRRTASTSGFGNSRVIASSVVHCCADFSGALSCGFFSGFFFRLTR